MKGVLISSLYNAAGFAGGGAVPKIWICLDFVIETFGVREKFFIN